MTLTVISHKPCWRSARSPTGFATDGGFPFQMSALADLFDETRLVVPVHSQAPAQGEIPLSGHGLRVVPLTSRSGRGFASKLSFLPWLLANSRVIGRELAAAQAVHAPIPGDVGTVGMLGAWLLRKPLLVRHCCNWFAPITVAEKGWRWFMEATGGGRNIMLATGGAAEPPSRRNPNVRWIFSSSLTREELATHGTARAFPARGRIRLILAARQEKAKGAGRIIQALPSLVRDFPHITFDVLGHGSALPEFQRLAAELKMENRVTFTGLLNHEQVLARLNEATIFVFPTTSSDGFPKAVLEGLAAGLPVVATRVSVLPQLLGNGCGVLIDDAGPEAIAQGVRAVLASATNYEAMSRQAIVTARNYSLEDWRDTIGNYLAAAWGPLRKGDGKRAQDDKAEAPVVTRAVAQ